MKKWILAVSALLAISAQAQTLSGVKVEPANAKAGEAVKITGMFDASDTSNCAVRVHYGDGQTEKIKIRKQEQMPIVLSRTYAKAGQYKVEIEPTTADRTLKCSGARQSAMLTVTAAPVAAPAAPAASAAKAAPANATTPCPAGWTLAKPGVNKKTQSFTCTAKAGTKIPEPKMACPGDLTYFDNSKKGQLGCRV